MNNICILASGSGTNAENIINFFKKDKKNNISLILSNKKDAYVIQRAINHNINHLVFNKDDFYNSDKILQTLKEQNINLIILAGFLWLVPENIIETFPKKIINIHPALLPKYGGKGMYGMNVHKSVVENKEKETGITIHFVNKDYDEGSIIFQAKCLVDKDDSPEDVANKVHELEYLHYPNVIKNLLQF